MNFLDKQFGRLGNRMFQMAALYTYAKDLGIDYYFQDEKYFKKYRQDILELFGQGIGYTDRVAIHVRRGDYINNPFYVDLMKTDYYLNAMAKFPNEHFILFSDDIKWCKEFFYFVPPIKYEFSEAKTQEEDLKLMASCKGIIMANSSFSWWAAYLSKADKIVYPNQWYSDGIQRTVCPKEWICI